MGDGGAQVITFDLPHAPKAGSALFGPAGGSREAVGHLTLPLATPLPSGATGERIAATDALASFFRGSL